MDERAPFPDNPEASWIQGMVHMLRTDQGVLVSCSFTTETQCECVRCLSPYQQEVGILLEEEYLPVIDIETGARIVLEDQDAFVIDDHHMLNLGEAVRQYFLLNLPMQPICREDCVGICPGCGVDLNQQECDCNRGVLDSRWVSLWDLKASRHNLG